MDSSSFISLLILKGDSKKTKLASILAYLLIFFERAFFFGGKKPKKIKLLHGKAAAAKAEVNAEGPATECIFIPIFFASLTNLYPGSLISGVPASDIKAMDMPLFKKLNNFGLTLVSLLSL